MNVKLNTYAANLLLLGLSLALILSLAEVTARIILRDKTTGLRPFEPFFVSGDFFNLKSETDFITRKQGPFGYGYIPSVGTYVYSQDEPVSMFDRVSFLFDHRLSLHGSSQVRSLKKEKPEAIRIFVIGGSSAQGTGASTKENTWHSILEKMLRKEFSSDDIYMINAAMGAFVSSQERIAFDLAVAPLEPDLTIILNGFNDLYIPTIFGTRPGDPYQTGYRYYQMYDTSIGRFLKEYSRLASYFIDRMAYKRLLGHTGSILRDKKKAVALGKGIADVYTANVRHMISRSSDNSPVMVFFQPWRDMSRKQAGLAPFSRTFRFHKGVFRQIKANFLNNNRFIDISSNFNTKEMAATFLDSVHFNDIGQKAIAQIIMRHIHKEVEKIVHRKSSREMVH